MSISVVSATETPDQVQAALGGLNPAPKAEQKSASADSQTDETLEASETSEEEAVETEEESEDQAESETDSDDEQKADERKPKKGLKGVEKKIKKLTSKISAKDQEIEFWKSQAMKAGGQKEPQQIETPKKEADPSDKPKAENFDSHEEYVEALTDWKLEQREKAKEAKAQQEQIKKQHETQIQTFQDKVKSFAEKHDDFQDLMEEVNDIPMSIAVQEGIVSSEFGPELMYELAKNRSEYERICKLAPIAAARELGKIEARLSKAAESETKPEIKVPKAPKPMTPVGAKSGGPVKKTIFDPNISQREYERLRAAEQN